MTAGNGAHVAYGAAGLGWGSGGLLLADQATPKSFTMPDLDLTGATIDATGAVLQAVSPSLSSTRFSNVLLDGAGATAVEATATFDGVTATTAKSL